MVSLCMMSLSLLLRFALYPGRNAPSRGKGDREALKLVRQNREWYGEKRLSSKLQPQNEHRPTQKKKVTEPLA